jgi:hypothetical protein
MIQTAICPLCHKHRRRHSPLCAKLNQARHANDPRPPKPTPVPYAEPRFGRPLNRGGSRFK